jgi:oligoribonuclease NrnB/cAMP/cGMP phosphodiesterase (DHH superfamily)
VAGLNVLICDFSYKKDTMLKLVSEAKTLAIIDHHKSAEEDLKDISDENKVFRMDHSGAFLTWAYFYPLSPMPLLIKYIEDNDIWIKAMPNTRELTSYIYSLPFEFEEYEKLLDEKVLLGDTMQVAIGMHIPQ